VWRQEYVLVAGLVENTGAELHLANAHDGVLNQWQGTKSVLRSLAMARAVKSMRVVPMLGLSSLVQVLIIIRYIHHFISKMQVLSVNNVEDE
jgi:hypothetical protein